MERNPLRDVLVALLGALSLLTGVLVADAAFTDSEPVFPEPTTNSTGFIPGDGDDPGAALGFVDVAAPEPVIPGATPVYPTIFDEEGVPTIDAPSEFGAGASDGGEEPPPPAGDQPPAAAGPAAASQAGLATVVRFLDLCTENPSGCPIGVAATVLFAGSAPALQIVPIPEADQALLGDDLRCDPGWPSSVEIPVVILSNRPLSLLHVRLKGPLDVLLDEEVNLKSPPSEHMLYQQKVAASQSTSATLKGGFHTCLTLRIDGVASPPSRQGYFELSVQAYADRPDGPGTDAASKDIVFYGQYEAFAPPVRLIPLDRNRAYMIVPQLPDDTTVVWVTHEYESYRERRSCDRPPPPLDERSLRRSPLAAPVETPGQDAADYPWDRAYSHHTLWDLRLQVGSEYTLCVAWMKEGKSEQWDLETPDGFELEVIGGNLRHTETRVEGTLLVHLLGMEGCFVANPRPYQGSEFQPFPYVTVYGDGTYTGGAVAEMCHSRGRYVGPEIELRALFPDGTNQVYGTLRKNRDLLFGFCGGLPWQQGPFFRQVAGCDDKLEWREPMGNVLCGGGLSTPDCRGRLLFALEVSFYSSWDDSNKRPNERDWGFSRSGRFGNW